MAAGIISLIMALISFFTAKKGGASNAQAAMAGAAVGAGSYYVTTQTEWGKNAIGAITGKWNQWFGSDGEPGMNPDGTPIRVPNGAEVLLDNNGNPRRDAEGNVMWKLIDSAGNVLQSWGPAGTAGVLATGGVLASSSIRQWLPLAALGLGAYLIITR